MTDGKQYISWQDIDIALDILSSQLEKKEFNKIYSLGRGGMVPTRLLSGRLKIKEVGLLDSFAKNHSKHIRYRSIICDDILDTGQTYLRIRNQRYIRQDTIFAFLFARKLIGNTSYANNVFVGKIFNHDKYLVFPWEAGAND